MAVSIVIYKTNGEVKGKYTGSTIGELTASIEDGEHYEVVENDYIVPTNIASDYHYIAYNIKQNKLKSINSIQSAVGDKVFDGDEVSQGRMLRAIQIAAVTGETTTTWKLADNRIVEVTLDELKEALALSGKEMSKIWLGE